MKFCACTNFRVRVPCLTSAGLNTSMFTTNGVYEQSLIQDMLIWRIIDLNKPTLA